jgi:hypothetical protein
VANFENYKNLGEFTGSMFRCRNGSEIWCGGFDNKQHADDILGSEWAGIYINEALDLSYEIYDKLQTRLNWTLDAKGQKVPLKLFIDYNPKSPSHWANRMYKKSQYPDGTKLPEDLAGEMTNIHFHILENKDNLNPKYIQKMQALRGSAKKRYYDGEVFIDAEGLVYYDFDRNVNIVDKPIEFNPDYETFTTWDFGVSDPTAILVCQVVPMPKSQEFPQGYKINVIDEYQNNNEDYQHYKNWLFKKPYVNARSIRHFGDPAGKNRDAQLKSWISLLAQSPNPVYIEYKKKYTIDEYVSNANLMMHAVRCHEKQTPLFVEVAENWKYPLDKSTGKKVVGSKPEHDHLSHIGTALYYGFTNRFPSKGGKLIV